MVEIRVLREDDDRRAFSSGDDALDLYFRRYAGQNQFRHHIGVTYVAVESDRILAFVTLAPATIDVDELPDGKRMPPYPVPVLRLARLGVDRDAQGLSLGTAMLRFTFEVAERMRDEVGCVGVLVDAKPTARDFYAKYQVVELEGLSGVPASVPRPIPMFLALGSVPRA